MMTSGRIWRRKRDLTIGLAWAQGASIRFLGDVFDLDPARVSRILARLRVEFASPSGLDRTALAAAIRSTRFESGRTRDRVAVRP